MLACRSNHHFDSMYDTASDPIAVSSKGVSGQRAVATATAASIVFNVSMTDVLPRSAAVIRRGRVPAAHVKAHSSGAAAVGVHDGSAILTCHSSSLCYHGNHRNIKYWSNIRFEV